MDKTFNPYFGTQNKVFFRIKSRYIFHLNILVLSLLGSIMMEIRGMLISWYAMLHHILKAILMLFSGQHFVLISCLAYYKAILFIHF